jgi:hypothetical protein
MARGSVPHARPLLAVTRKVHGKTVTQRVSEEQAALLRTWLENARHLDQLLAEIDLISTRSPNRILAATHGGGGQTGESGRSTRNIRADLLFPLPPGAQ